MNSLSQCSDEELCILAQSGDPAAEDHLAVRYRRLVLACARPYFLAGGDGEDLIQEGMLGLLSAIRSFDAKGEALFPAYAETCVRNRIFSAIRSATRGKHMALNQSLSLDPDSFEKDAGYSELFQTESMEDTLIGREESLSRIRALSRGLSKLESAVLERYLEGHSYSQIAHLTGKPLKSVDNAVQRIRRKAAIYLSSGDNSIS